MVQYFIKWLRKSEHLNLGTVSWSQDIRNAQKFHCIEIELYNKFIEAVVELKKIGLFN